MKNIQFSEDPLETLVSATIIALINQKFVENYDNSAKAEVLTEVLNEIKLCFTPPISQELH